MRVALPFAKPLLICVIGLSIIPLQVEAQNCKDVCVEDIRIGQSIDLYVENHLYSPVEINLSVNSENMYANVALPYRAIHPGKERTHILRLYVDDRRRAWKYKYDFRWKEADGYGAIHDDSYIYSLPYAPGTSHTVSQGFNGKFSHQGKNAIDWTMPISTPIHAAREGEVIAVEISHGEGGPKERYRNSDNYIRIRHRDGSIGSYVHLVKGGSQVALGQFVEKGQLIGYSGNSGFSSGPHLHFEVYVRDGEVEKVTIPVKFKVAGQSGIKLAEGRTYIAQ